MATTKPTRHTTKEQPKRAFETRRSSNTHHPKSNTTSYLFPQTSTQNKKATTCNVIMSNNTSTMTETALGYELSGRSSVVCLRGVVGESQEKSELTQMVSLRISGRWSGEGIGGRFEYVKVGQTSDSVSISGIYDGWFDNGEATERIRDDGVEIRVRDSKWSPNGDQIVQGAGKNGYGQYTITGVLAKDNTITMHREYITAPSQRRHSTRKASSNTSSEGVEGVMTRCKQILEFIQNKDRRMESFFDAPVDTTAYPEYIDIVKEPMDLGTINSRLRNREINTPEEFARLIRLVFHNAMIFNVDPLHPVHQTAKGLLDIFERRYLNLQNQIGVASGNKTSQKTCRKRSKGHQKCNRLIASDKRKQAASIKRRKTATSSKIPAMKTLTDEEQGFLVDAVNSLDDVDPIVKIIREAVQFPFCAGEIDLDLKQLDAPTQLKIFQHPLVSKVTCCCSFCLHCRYHVTDTLSNCCLLSCRVYDS